LGFGEAGLSQGAGLLGGFAALRRRGDRGRTFGLDVGQGGPCFLLRLTLTGEGGLGVFAGGRDRLLPHVPDQALHDGGRHQGEARRLG
jgi:hypothetical protein